MYLCICMIDRQTVDRIMSAADIVDVVRDFVTLKKSGVNYKGLCPFHNERTPSFIVSPSRGICHCFSCGKGGNAVNFIMEHEQMTYPEALRWLAKKYNIEIKEKELTPEERQKETKRESLFIVNNWAVKYFENILHNDVDGKAVGMAYFRSRGFSDDIIAKFRLGFCTSGKDAMTKAALAEGYKAEYLHEAGLSVRRDDGSMYDRYNGRVIFPWFNLSGRVCAFGGRLLSAQTKGVAQKYVNSPDSDIYHKDHELYGLYQSKKAIVKEDRVFMVEGYTDVISMHQCGIENVVANSGTALSVHQIHILHRFTSNITLLYDGDEAGIHAAMRGTDMLLSEGMNIKVLLFPDNDDPDSFSRKHTAEEFREYINNNQKDFITFKINVLLGNNNDPIKRSEAINNIVKSISVIPDPITRATYLQECSMLTGIKEQTLIITMNRLIHKEKEDERKRQERERERAESEPVTTEVSKPDTTTNAVVEKDDNPIETLLLQMIIRHGDQHECRVIGDDGLEYNFTVAQYVMTYMKSNDLEFSSDLYNRILLEAVEHSGMDGFTASTYFINHPDFEVSTLASKLMQEQYQLNITLPNVHTVSIKDQVDHLLAELTLNGLDKHILDLKREMAAAGNDISRKMEVMKEIGELQKERNIFAKQVGRTNRIVKNG